MAAKEMTKAEKREKRDRYKAKLKLYEFAGYYVTDGGYRAYRKPARPSDEIMDVDKRKTKIDRYGADVKYETPRLSLLDAIAEADVWDKELRVGTNAMLVRAGDFRSSTEARLAGIAVHPPARAKFEALLDNVFENQAAKVLELPPRVVSEVVVGAGFHAAVYCAIRVAQGKPKPLVLERSSRVGGTFAMTETPTFFLNSRNRPGPLGTPGRGEALNVLPGAPIQPSMLSGLEYQTNADLAFAIRCSLAANARVIAGVNVDRFTERSVEFTRAEQDGSFETKRIIWATGIGAPKRPTTGYQLTDSNKRRLLYFDDAMKWMASKDFPMRGLGRVAVVGSGDSGKTAIEALLGQGPQMGMTVMGLDALPPIDWYGVNPQALTRDGWTNCVRSRYRDIARALPRGGVADRDAPPRVRPLTDRVETVQGSYDGLLVNGRKYDHVIWCAGHDEPDYAGDYVQVGGRFVGLKLYDDDEVCDRYAIGPAAKIPLDVREVATLPSDVPENVVAMFRYADRTAQMATYLS